jgi:hypothetical protein
MQSIFLVLNEPNDMHIEFLCASEVAAGKMTCIISNLGKPFAQQSEMAVSTRDKLRNSSFFSKTTHPLSD